MNPRGRGPWATGWPSTAGNAAGESATSAANALAADGHPVDPDDLATISPYITHKIRRFGDWVLNLSRRRSSR